MELKVTTDKMGTEKSLKILYIATSFPEPGTGATIYTDLAEALHDAGHDITVAVSEQPRSGKSTSIREERGLEVLRIKTGDYYDVGNWRKGITTLLLPLKMKRGIKKYLCSKRFDLILYESPPVTNAAIVRWAKKFYNARSFLMLKDIFPQNAVDLEIIRENGIIHRYFKTRERNLYRSADTIGCMSKANVEYVLKHNPWIDPGKVIIFPNAKKITDDYLPNGYPMRKKYGIGEDKCVFLFGGNMGKPQYMDLHCRMITAFKDDERAFFLYVGRGTEKYKVEDTIKKENIKNALILDNLPRDEYEQITRECDVGLLTLDPRFTVPNYPSRILSYMEYAKPVIAATDKATDIRELIEESGCGEWCWSGDEDEVYRVISDINQKICSSIIGENGRLFIVSKLKSKFLLDSLLKIK